MAAQKQEEDAAGEAFEATLTESESESDEDDDKDDDLVFQKYEKHEDATQDPAANLTEDEVQQNKEEFQAMMKVWSTSLCVLLQQFAFPLYFLLCHYSLCHLLLQRRIEKQALVRLKMYYSFRSGS